MCGISATVVVSNLSQYETCQRFQGLGVWKAPSSLLSSLFESDSVYKIPIMPTGTGMGQFGARSLGLW